MENENARVEGSEGGLAPREGRGVGMLRRALGTWGVAVALAVLWVYRRLLSPLLHGLTLALAGPGAGCRFVPTCSEYAGLALRKHGLRRGLLLAVHRISRCRPGCPGGVDYP